jgi:DNA-binding NarL/FixJ family response regulator
MVTLLLADDHAVVREGLRALLEAEAGFSVVGEAGNGLEALRLVERLRPQVLVLDLMMPGLGGLEVTREVAKKFSATHVVVLSMYSSESYVMEAMKKGAAAYVLKGSSRLDLVTAIREAAAGRRFLSSPLSEHAISAYLARPSGEHLDDYENLTRREREVLQLLAEGHSHAEIGSRLFISPRTVESHKASLMRKLALRTQTDLIRYALERGLLPRLDVPRAAR